MASIAALLIQLACSNSHSRQDSDAIEDGSEENQSQSGDFESETISGTGDAEATATVTGDSSGQDSSGADGASSSDTTATISDAGDTESTGGQDDTGGDERCDGGEKLVFASRSELGGRPAPGSEVRFDVGTNYLYVAGDCSYWALPSAPIGDDSGKWPGTRYGVLNSQLWTEIRTSLYYDNWPSLSGTWAQGTSSPTPFRWTDGASELLCLGICPQAAGAPDEVIDMFHRTFGQDDAVGWIKRMWSDGAAMSGPLRVQGFAHEQDQLHDEEKAINWELDWPMADLSTTKEDFGKLGTALLVDDPDDIAYLREIKRKYKANEIDPGKINTLHDTGNLYFRCPFDDLVYEFWMRDELPFAGDDGLVPSTAFEQR